MDKLRNISLLVLITLMFATVCMETDIYVPAFPEMKNFFLTSSDSIQKVLSINFIGICLGSLLFGPLSDALGRQKALRLGLILFALSSWGCLLFTNFQTFLLCRFIQGIGAATPMVISFAVLLENYEQKKVAQICGGLNLFITGVMAAAPILGSYLTIRFGWQYNFLIIALLASLSLIGSFFFLPETLAKDKRIPFSFKKISSNYALVLRNFHYMAAALICYLMFAGLILFTANLSLIFVEHLGIAKEVYGFYQASAPGAFALFSLLSIWIIEYWGTEKTKAAGVFCSVCGAFLLLLSALTSPNPFYICLAMVVFTAGITLAAPIYGTESANVFPKMLGIATGMSNALRHMVVAGVVGIGSLSFNGSILPVSLLILLVTIMVVALASLLINKSWSISLPIEPI